MERSNTAVSLHESSDYYLLHILITIDCVPWVVAGVDRGKGSEGHIIRALAVLGWAGEGQLYNKYFAKIFYFWLF